MIPRTQEMGPQDRTKGHLHAQILQNLQPNPGGKHRTGQIFKGQPRQRLHSTISVTNGVTILLRQQKGWKT